MSCALVKQNYVASAKSYTLAVAWQLGEVFHIAATKFNPLDINQTGISDDG